MPSVFLRLTTQKGDNMGAVHGLSRGATRSFNRGATASGSRFRSSPVENIQEDTEYSPEPIQMVQRQPSFSAVGSRYPRLREADIEKVDKAFAKIFEPVFHGFRGYLIDKHLNKSGPGHIFKLVQE